MGRPGTSGSRRGARDRKDTTSFGAGGGGAAPAPVAAAPSPVAPTSSGVGTVEHAMERMGDAWHEIDRRNGGTNFVKLADLRDAIPGVGREQFDAAINRLRRQGVLSLDSHEGLHGDLTDRERRAGIREAGTLLIYVSRRKD